MLHSIVQIAFASAGLCFISYCIYFDKKRRSVPDFKQKLRKKREQQTKDNQDASDFPVPLSNSPAVLQKFFLQHVQKAEIALSMGLIDEGIKCFAIAVSVCGQPTQLLQVLQQSLSPNIYLKLKDILPSVQTKYKALMENNSPFAKEIEEDLE